MIKVAMIGLDAVKRTVANLEKQTRYATAVALTRTAKAVKDAMPAALERDLDRPTPFTKKGLYVKGAKPGHLVAEVGFMDRQASYLKYQIAGGTRTPTARGIRLPGNIQLNSFGNIPKGLTDKLKAAAQSGQLSKAIGKRIGAGDRRKGAAPIQLFYGKPTGRGWDKAPMGIWRRTPGKPGKLVPVIVFEDTPARYQPRFNFHREAERVIRSEWDRQFSTAFAEAMRTAR
ncbi:MAG: hypothetical protein Q8J72_12670 [Rhodocyclaceae bacterium]|nr:hypothetical protein [Rhodocyclaceae bacterium]